MTKLSIGSQLKKARQKKEITLSEVYKQTRIHPNILTALEEDTYDNVLNPIYMRSFLKRYAAYLGLDEKTIVDEYNGLHKQVRPKEGAAQKPVKEEEITPSAKDKTVVEEESKEGEKPWRPKLPKISIRLPWFDRKRVAKAAGAIIGIIIALLILIKAAAFIADKISRGFTHLAKKAEEMKKTAQIQKARETGRSKPAQEAKHVKAEEPLLYTPVTAVKEEKPAPEKAPEPAPAKPKQVSVPEGERLQLTIRVTNDVWVQLKVDGKIIFQNVLKKGSAETWKAQNSFEIWTGRSEAMYLNLNGNDLGVLGSGVEKGVVVTREGIKR